MRTAGTDVISWRNERARVGSWRGEADVATLAPLPDAPLPSPEFVRHCLTTLASRGVARVVTGALAAAEQQPFLLAGFSVRERLHLLAHDLVELPDVPALDGRLRRARRGDVPAVLAVDAAAFDPFWRLDEHGLRDAVVATPTARFRVATAGDRVVGYAVMGRAGTRGYLQRLAVAPEARRAGVASALVVDGLRWLRRWRASQALVNTQLENDGALALYERLGFRREPTGLSVLEARLR